MRGVIVGDRRRSVARARLAQARGDKDAAFQAVRAAEQVLDTLKSAVRHSELQAALRANLKLPDDVR